MQYFPSVVSTELNIPANLRNSHDVRRCTVFKTIARAAQVSGSPTSAPMGITFVDDGNAIIVVDSSIIDKRVSKYRVSDGALLGHLLHGLFRPIFVLAFEDIIFCSGFQDGFSAIKCIHPDGAVTTVSRDVSELYAASYCSSMYGIIVVGETERQIMFWPDAWNRSNRSAWDSCSFWRVKKI